MGGGGGCYETGRADEESSTLFCRTKTLTSLDHLQMDKNYSNWNRFQQWVDTGADDGLILCLLRSRRRVMDTL